MMQLIMRLTFAISVLSLMGAVWLTAYLAFWATYSIHKIKMSGETA
jgi:hypothetical protein